MNEPHGLIHVPAYIIASPTIFNGVYLLVSKDCSNTCCPDILSSLVSQRPYPFLVTIIKKVEGRESGVVVDSGGSKYWCLCQ